MMRLIDADKLLEDYLILVLENSGIVDAGQVCRIIKNAPSVSESNITVGDTVYVVTKYRDYEIIECSVTRLTYKNKFTFTVHGQYKHGNYYTANYVKKSIGKSVFVNKEDAENKLSLLVTKKGN